MAEKNFIKAEESAKEVAILRLRKTSRFAIRAASLRMTGMLAIVFWLLMSGARTWAATYYVSSSAGSDANSGTSAGAAWQTIGHVNGQTLQPGDSVLFKRGDVWNESLVPGSSGSSGNPIVFDAYGTGAAPNLTGYYAVPSTAWVLVTGNAWKAAVPATYTTINFCLFGSVWGQKVAAVSSNLTAQWDFYLANGFLYVYSVGNPATFYNEAIVPMALSNVPVINVNGKSWLTFQHFLVNWFDQYGVYVQGVSDHLVLANMESDSMIPQGTQPLGFYVDEGAPGPGDIKIYNSEGHLNYDAFRFDGAATAITMVNDKAYGNRDGALVDNTGAVTYSYCHFYASSLAVAGSTDVEWTSGSGPIAGAGNIAQDTAPAVQVYQRYPAEVTLTVDDAGMTAGADTYYAGTVLPIADAAGVPVGAAITVGYALAQTLVSEFQGWVTAGRDVASHSMSHTYYTNTDALEIQYTGSGTAAMMSISGKTLTITVTGASDSVSYNLAQGQAEGTIKLLRLVLQGTGKYTATEILACQGPYGTGCSAYTESALLAQDLADVSGQDVRTAVYHTQLDVTRLTTDEITLSRQWMTTNLTGLPATPVYVYPGGYETTTMQGITAGVPYKGARGALKEDLGVSDTYADGFNVQNITSFGVNPSWMGLAPAILNQKIQALVWKESVWGVPWGIFWHVNELTNSDPVGGTEITNLIQDFKASGATIQTNTGLVNWLLAGTQEAGPDGNYYYTIPATSMVLDFRPTRNSPVVDAGQNLGTAFALDINGVNQNSYGSGWEIGAHVYQGYAGYGGGAGSGSFTIGGNLLIGPPNYLGSTASTANPGTIAPLYISVTPTATTCSGMCQNSTAYDTTLNPWGVDPMTRITDGSTVMSGGLGGSVGNLSCSGGDNDRMISVNSTYLGVAAGGAAYIYHLSQATGKVQVVNSGGPPGITVGCPMGFSWITDTRFFYMPGSINSQVWQGDINSDSTFTATMLVDLMAPGVCPGVTPFTVVSNGILGISDDDDKFSTLLGPGGQGTADWVFVWSRSLGCATVNFSTGQAWNYLAAGTCSTSACSEAIAPIGTMGTSSTTCWGSSGGTGHGVHDSQFSGDGNYVNVSITLTWTQGGCAGLNTPGYVFWQVGTTGNQWCQNVGVGTLNCGAHQSDGITHLLTPSFNGYNVRTLSSVSSYSAFLAPVNQEDAHAAWPHICTGTIADTCPWIMGADSVLTTAGTVGTGGCTSAVYCPNYLNNMIYAVFPNAAYPPGQLPRLFAHTYECAYSSAVGQAQCSDGLVDAFGAGGAIGVVSPRGDMFCWASSMLHQVGLDNVGKPRIDAYCILLQ